ncbi:MAG: DegV family protein [Lachnospiraceae bacterium]|nr:DegV family protein [Lachnospiraceae bacterium]
MSKVAIMTDSNSGITQAQAKEMGVFVLPMPFYINGDLFFEDISLNHEQFYQKLAENADISTSQPGPSDVLAAWDEVLKDYDEIVHIPMSSGLSGSCSSAHAMSLDYDGRVQVVDNQRISVTQKQSVRTAFELAKQGKSAAEIKEYLLNEKMQSSIYIMVDTLKYLKKGGRVTPAAALIGEVLNIKPVLQIQGEKLDAYSKCRGNKQAKKIMLNAMKDDIEGRFKDIYEAGKLKLFAVHSQSEEEAKEFAKEAETMFPKAGPIETDALSLSVSCHIGPGSLALACSITL